MPLTWPYAYRSLTSASREGRGAPFKGLPLMKTSRFLAGLPYFSAAGVHGGAAYAGETERRTEQHSRDGMSCYAPKESAPKGWKARRGEAGVG